MNVRWPVLLLATLPIVAAAQAPLPSDIDPVTLSRLPPVTPADLDEEGQRLLAESPNFRAAPGPSHVTIYSPDGRNLGIPMGNGSFVGARNFQLATLIVAREIDQQFEWTNHEPAGLQVGLEQDVIDVVKYDRDVAGLSPADATFITFGRDLLRKNRVSSELWAEMVRHFGKQGTVTLMTVMGEYLKVGIMLNAVDQHLPEGREALLPELAR